MRAFKNNCVYPLMAVLCIPLSNEKQAYPGVGVEVEANNKVPKKNTIVFQAVGMATCVLMVLSLFRGGGW